MAARGVGLAEGIVRPSTTTSIRQAPRSHRSAQDLRLRATPLLKSAGSLSGSVRAARLVHYANGMPRGSQLAGSDPLVLVYVACVFAAALLIPALLCRFVFPARPSDPDADDGWGKGPQQPPIPPDPPRGGVPLDDAEPSQVRLRDHGRLAHRRNAAERRRVQEPDRYPVRTPRPGSAATGSGLDP